MFGKIKFYLFLLVVLVGVLIYWKHDVEQKALLEYNQRQLEQAVKDKEEFQQKMTEIQDKQRTVEEDLAKQNNEVSQKLNNLDSYLSSSETTKQNKQSSNILKNTIIGLSGEKK
jgi:septal ring factor EnvC (AmiA/AmiB activator)